MCVMYLPVPHHTTGAKDRAVSPLLRHWLFFVVIFRVVLDLPCKSGASFAVLPRCFRFGGLFSFLSVLGRFFLNRALLMRLC